MKIRLKRTDRQGLWDGIWKAYEGDEEMRAIHILQNASLEEMVRYTWEQSTEDEERAGQQYYQLLLPDGTLIGYTTLVQEPVKLLFTFGLGINYRKREILLGWLKALDRKLGYRYMLTVRSSNTRAVKFFQRNGFSVMEDKPNNQYILWRQPQSC